MRFGDPGTPENRTTRVKCRMLNDLSQFFYFIYFVFGMSGFINDSKQTVSHIRPQIARIMI